MIIQKFAPIALFVYNRPEHTRRTVDALKKNTLAMQSDLIIFSDAAKSNAQAEMVHEVRKYIRQIVGFKSITIIENKENYGLARSIINAVTQICEKHGKIIVLEDDLITSNHFLSYMNNALDIYEKEPNVISINGYMFPVAGPLPETFFLCDPGCWGWATWKRGWDLFELDGNKLLAQIKKNGQERKFNFSDSYDYIQMLKSQIAGHNDSWAVRWYASAFLSNKLTLYPGQSLVVNIGNDGSGRHAIKTEDYSVELANNPVNVGGIDVKENMLVRSELIKYLIEIRLPLTEKIYFKLKKFYRKKIFQIKFKP